jgi:hypothetical protein
MAARREQGREALAPAGIALGILLLVATALSAWAGWGWACN